MSAWTSGAEVPRQHEDTVMPYHTERARQSAERDHRIAELLKLGWSHREIGRELQTSGAAVTQRVQASPTLRRLIRSHRREEQLHRLRREAGLVANELKAMQADIRTVIRELEEELMAIETDRLLGLR